MIKILEELSNAYGVSGMEHEVRSIILKHIRRSVDTTEVDRMGNLICRKKGSNPPVMLAAHMDEIGLVVTYADEKGYLRFAPTGGVSPVTLVGSRVRFENGVTGVIGWEKWMRPDAGSSRPEFAELYIDAGAIDRDQAPVSVGDAAVFVRPLEELGQRLVAKAMDDRLGCAIAIQTLAEIGQTPNDLYFCFTVQEEVGTRGAVPAAYGIEPAIGLAVDVTLVGDTPKARPMAVSLGQGPAIKIMDGGMLAHSGIVRWMIQSAERAGIPYQREVLQAGSTDARSIQLSRAGVPTGCLSIPCRYVHTPSEMVDYGDVLHAVQLLTELLSREITL
jgi:endoglucanase